jgi:hypothetical protein
MSFELDYRVLSERLRIKEICRSVHSTHLILVMSSSERLTPKGRKRALAQNNKEAKTEQLKLRKTYPST